MTAQLFYHKGVYQLMGTPMETAHQGLSVKQELALELILCGMNDKEIAKRAGVYLLVSISPRVCLAMIYN